MQSCRVVWCCIGMHYPPAVSMLAHHQHWTLFFGGLVIVVVTAGLIILVYELILVPRHRHRWARWWRENIDHLLTGDGEQHRHPEDDPEAG